MPLCIDIHDGIPCYFVCHTRHIKWCFRKQSEQPFQQHSLKEAQKNRPCSPLMKEIIYFQKKIFWVEDCILSVLLCDTPMILSGCERGWKWHVAHGNKLSLGKVMNKTNTYRLLQLLTESTNVSGEPCLDLKTSDLSSCSFCKTSSNSQPDLFFPPRSISKELNWFILWDCFELLKEMVYYKISPCYVFCESAI